MAWAAAASQHVATHSTRKLRSVFLEQESTAFAQSVGPEGEENGGNFQVEVHHTAVCILIPTLKVVLLLQVQPQQTWLFRAYKINGSPPTPITAWQLAALSGETGGDYKIKCKKLSL